MKKISILSILLVTAMLISLFALPTAAKSGEAIDLVISEPVKNDNEFSVKISAENISETIHVVEFVLNYDSEKLELTNGTDDEGAFECVSKLPKNWENFTVAPKDGSLKVLMLTANSKGLASGELEFEFKFRIKDGASGEATVLIPDSEVLGAYVGNSESDIKEYGGKGGKVVIVISESGDIEEVSTETESAQTNGDTNEGTEDASDDDGKKIGGISITVWIILFVLVISLVGYATYCVFQAKKRMNKGK